MTHQPPDFAGLLQGDCADEVLRLLLFAMNELARSTGARPSPKAIRLLHMLHKAARGPQNLGTSESSGRVDGQALRETLTVREMADRMGCSTRYIRQLLIAGRLAGRKSGGVWIIHCDRLLPNSEAS